MHSHHERSLSILRQTHSERLVGQTPHGMLTGKQATAASVSGGRAKSEMHSRPKWEKDRSDRVLLLGPAEILDPLGRHGVWDVLSRKAGLKNVPPYNQVPWPLALNSGFVLLVWSDGRAAMQLGTGTPSEAVQVENVLEESFAAKWLANASYAADAHRRSNCIKYGMACKKAEQFQAAGFRAGGRR